MNIIIWYGKLLITANLHTHNTFSDNLNLISCLLLPSNALVLNVFNLFLCFDTNKIVSNSKQTFYLHKFEIFRNRDENFQKWGFIQQWWLWVVFLYKHPLKLWVSLKNFQTTINGKLKSLSNYSQILAVIFPLFSSFAWFRTGIDCSGNRIEIFSSFGNLGNEMKKYSLIKILLLRGLRSRRGERFISIWWLLTRSN